MATNPSPTLAVSSPSPVGLIVRITSLDFLRRKDLYVVAILMGLFVIAAVTVRVIRVQDADTARFLMSAGLTLSHVLAAILAASFCGRAFPEEFDQGTLMPLLAKPVSRAQVVIGKAAACAGLVLGSYLLFVIATLATVRLAPGQEWTALFQVITLQAVSLALTGAIALALSFHTPAVLAAVIALAWYFGGGFFLSNAKTIALRAGGEEVGGVIARFFSCLPDVSMLTHTEVFAGSTGHLALGLYLGLLAYGLAWTAGVFLLGVWQFERMRL